MLGILNTATYLVCVEFSHKTFRPAFSNAGLFIYLMDVVVKNTRKIILPIAATIPAKGRTLFGNTSVRLATATKAVTTLNQNVFELQIDFIVFYFCLQIYHFILRKRALHLQHK